ncbi:hypothetical protein CALCODRAFT_324532 [Calocera cornea HHB12733]|uniref:Uncharacterized protein n=1 Tax=Calocera cornea HHB12733 TaxID=1353952 RepID=A0A165F4D0_9BASI|nr:hypothetical protein CALCODRAFT_324532 [Calocera cornea HHB12733]
MLLLTSLKDARDITTYLSSVCNDTPSAYPSQSPGDSYHPVGQTPGQIPTYPSHPVGPIRSPTDTLYLPSQLVRYSGDERPLGQTNGGANMRPSVMLSQSRAPVNSQVPRIGLKASQINAPQVETAQLDTRSTAPDIYSMPPQELESLIGRVVREDGFQELMDRMKALWSARST